MKKLIIGLLFLTISLIGYTENRVDDVINAVGNTAEAVNQSTEEVNATVVYFTEKLEELAKSLKVPAEHVYQVLVKQQIVSSIVDLAVFFVGVILVVLCFIVAFHKNTDWDEPGFGPISSIIMGALSLILIIYGALSINSIISGFINPEYGAIKEIMSLF